MVIASDKTYKGRPCSTRYADGDDDDNDDDDRGRPGGGGGGGGGGDGVSFFSPRFSVLLLFFCSSRAGTDDVRNYERARACAGVS